MNQTGLFHFADPDFTGDIARSSELFLKVNENKLSFAVTDGSTQRVQILFDSLSKPLSLLIEEVKQKSSYFSFDYSSIKVSAETSHFTFIPNRFYNESDLETYSELIGTNGTVRVTEVNASKIKTVSSHAEEVLQPILQSFPMAKIFTQAEPMIEAGLKVYGDQDLIIHFNTSSVEFLNVDKGQLKFYNIFEIESADDFNYYLLYVLQHLDLRPEDLKVVLAGDIERGSENHRRVKKYFNKINFADSRMMINFPEGTNGIQHHKFFSLFSLILCE